MLTCLVSSALITFRLSTASSFSADYEMSVFDAMILKTILYNIACVEQNKKEIGLKLSPLSVHSLFHTNQKNNTGFRCENNVFIAVLMNTLSASHLLALSHIHRG